MRFRPVSLALLIDEVADLIATRPAGAWTRVAVDGAPPANPAAVGEALAEALRLRGRAVQRVSAADFLRPASLRFERGRTDPDARYEDWLDIAGLIREVLAPLAPDGSGRVLPSLWNAETDRASRAGYRELPAGGVLVLDGELLLGRDLPFEHTMHLWLSGPALARRTPADEVWMLPAFERYDAEACPLDNADTVVRVDDPDHPALRDQTP